MKRLIFLLAASLLLTACGSANDHEEQTPGLDEEQALKELNVEILTAEDAFEPGVEGKIEIKVTEGDEPVSDADEVLFEIWTHGHQEDSEKIDGELEGDGIYSLMYTFEEAGIYYVVPHVTARGKHTMPKQAFNVGNVEEPQEEDVYDGHHDMGHHDNHEQDRDHDEHH